MTITNLFEYKEKLRESLFSSHWLPTELTMIIIIINNNITNNIYKNCKPVLTVLVDPYMHAAMLIFIRVNIVVWGSKELEQNFLYKIFFSISIYSCYVVFVSFCHQSVRENTLLGNGSLFPTKWRILFIASQQMQ